MGAPYVAAQPPLHRRQRLQPVEQRRTSRRHRNAQRRCDLRWQRADRPQSLETLFREFSFGNQSPLASLSNSRVLVSAAYCAMKSKTFSRHNTKDSLTSRATGASSCFPMPTTHSSQDGYAQDHHFRSAHGPRPQNLSERWSRHSCQSPERHQLPHWSGPSPTH